MENIDESYFCKNLRYLCSLSLKNYAETFETFFTMLESYNYPQLFICFSFM